MDKKDRNITCFMLGFHRVFVIIRSNISSPENINLIRIINSYCSLLKGEHIIKFVDFKSEISKSVKGNFENQEIVKNALNLSELEIVTDNIKEINRYIPIINCTTVEILRLLKCGSFNRAYDLVDAIHCLPKALMYKNIWSPNDYLNIYIKPYREKWDEKFLFWRDEGEVQ